ncbi:hypothetical protein PV10_01249 [Exophiala mesophila]|uniref:IQ calmodulin-binding motif domain protein n=1 Tax=Exophiala mesophila TaxID=212818 RepID=A0A0D1ZUC3_EXOME|nr:uncharacterized protein PV10_01249 [Exophiala mesophila]KIV97499.1 hypothetical protein PV10_01249 [Exophiala mesophila]
MDDPIDQVANQDVEMNLFETDASDACRDPPARLAARFCRKSNARRKTSANSSRRSSLSSVHSHSSVLSSHGGPHSNHIAQHLRRASIIESRKARLASKAAHAEQVRLRAAAAKASQRANNTEEKAQAAQAAREKLLAEITARCEEEVRRAKKIAEETKEKKAAELARLKEEMAEKFAVAAHRKFLYQQGQRRSRATSLTAVEEKKVAPVVKRTNRVFSAKVIQRAWRYYQTRKLVSAFSAVGLSLKVAKSSPFEELRQVLARDDTISTTLALFKYLGLLGEVQDDSSMVRVFLSSFMILAHPVQALSHGGHDGREQDLISKAAALVDAFESYTQAILSVYRPSKPLPAKEQLSFAVNDFCATFDTWKSQDLNTLVDIMISSFVNLDLIIQATKNDHEGHVADDYLEAVRQEQVKLLARLKRMAGTEEALARVRVAVRKARKQYAADKKRKTAVQVPRATTPNEVGVSEHGAPLTPPATPQPEVRSMSPKTSSFADSLGQIMTVLPSNREIAHEIQINGTFEVQQRPWTEARKDLMDSLQSNMRLSMQDGSGESITRWTHAMAVLIRDKLMNLISPRHPLHDRIDGFLDPVLIRQQSVNGVFSYDSFFQTISGMISQICSPGRDEAVKAFSTNTSGDTIKRFFELIDIIDLMTLDHINFQFRLASQSVLEKGHEHEFVSFERDIQTGVHALERTKQWWANARSSLSTPRSTGSAIYARGLVDLVLRNSGVQYVDFPETLQLDYVRLLKLRARVFHVIATSSILLTTKIRLRRHRESLWTNDAQRLMSLDLQTVDANRIVSLIESSHMMPDSTKEGVANFVGRVLPPAAAAAHHVDLAEQEYQDALHNQVAYDFSKSNSAGTDGEEGFSEQIASFLLKSLREHVFARLSASGTAERVRTTTGAAEALARLGMPEFLDEVNRLVNSLDKIRTVDLKAHSKWYDQIAAADEAT